MGEGIAGTNPTLSAIINPIESSRYMHQLGPACLRRAERRFRHAEHAKTVLISHNVHGTHVADPPSQPLGKTVDDCGDLRCRMTTREAPMLRSPLRDHSFLKSGGLNFSVDHMLDRRCELLHESPMKSRRSLALGASAVGSQEGLAPWNSRVAWLPHVGPHVDGCDARGAVRIGLLNSRRRAETLRAVHGRMAPHRPSDGLTGDGLGTCARRQTSEVGLVAPHGAESSEPWGRPYADVALRRRPAGIRASIPRRPWHATGTRRVARIWPTTRRETRVRPCGTPWCATTSRPSARVRDGAGGSAC